MVTVKGFVNKLNDWKSLGLKLGLLYPTLKRIEEDNRGIDKCLTEMLAAWLQQKDNVSQVGIPSLTRLQTALNDIGEHELASEISS